MKRSVGWLIAILGIGLIAFVLYYAMQKKPEPPPAPPTPPVAAPSAPAAPPEPQIRYPVAEQPQEKPLPALDKSDRAVREALGELWDEKTLARLLRLDEFIRRVVATIDNLPRQKLALRLMPVKLPSADSRFRIVGKGESLAISPDNSQRYARYVQLAGSIDTVKLVAFYARFYPLFQQAYRELGYPGGYFNDRLVDVIDHLLAAPEMEPAVKLVQPKVFYLYADPDLEARSAGQKILMRIGSDNAARIKAKLREIRSELTRHGPQPREGAAK